MVRVEIPDRHPLHALGERIERGDCDVAEITKTHRAITHCMMTRWAHHTESAMSLHRGARYVQGGASGSRCMFVDAGVGRRVRIEIVRRLMYAREMFARVSTQHDRFIGGVWLTPLPISMPILQKRDRACDSFWPLGMPGRRIGDATRIVKDDHGDSLRRRSGCGYCVGRQLG